jgi:hypothetical protein
MKKSPKEAKLKIERKAPSSGHDTSKRIAEIPQGTTISKGKALMLATKYIAAQKLSRETGEAYLSIEDIRNGFWIVRVIEKKSKTTRTIRVNAKTGETKEICPLN